MRATLRWAVTIGLGCLAAGVAQGGDKPPIPPHGPGEALFDGRDLQGLDTYLKSTGLNADPNHVFTVEHGTIHVSGREMGYLITKQSFEHYYLRAEFKWGTGTFGERAGRTRDSGILYNVAGEQKVWPRSLEFQVTEGGTGDIWLTDGAALTTRTGERVTAPAGSAVEIPRLGKTESEDPAHHRPLDVTGYRTPTGEVERPHGQWNVLELVNDGHTVRQYVNGRLVNEGTNPFPASGKILFQSEGAEVYFRRMVLYPLE